ncbi:hypothetical protein ACP4OV_031183 [Aristida adscensionis]
MATRSESSVLSPPHPILAGRCHPLLSHLVSAASNSEAQSPLTCSSSHHRFLILTEKCGYGLVAEDEIKKGEFIIEYVGEVIDDKACEERLWKTRRYGGTNFYLCEVKSNMVIDATNKGNMSRYINHSCEPNSEMQKWTVDGETRVGIFALRNIRKGEELTYDYKFVQFGAGQDCHCGSSNCRKFLGLGSVDSEMILHKRSSGSSQDVQVKRQKKLTTCENCLGQILRLWHRRQRMYVACWVVGFDQKTRLHTLKFLDKHKETFNMTKEDWDFLPDPDEPTDDEE